MDNSFGFFLILLAVFSIFTVITIHFMNQLQEKVVEVEDEVLKVKDMLNYTITVSFLNKIITNSSSYK